MMARRDTTLVPKEEEGGTMAKAEHRSGASLLAESAPPHLLEVEKCSSTLLLRV
jgi:hypothetical protein